ncbi:TlpA family protein disulfide reductase [Nonlabens ponticola]|nr:TlpA disulfide reductase family protein [Nonlabens ponticola]
MKNWFVLIFLMVSSFYLNAQTLVYKLEDGVILTDSQYHDYKVEMLRTDMMGTITRVKTVGDSIIRSVEFKNLSSMNSGLVDYLGPHWRNLGKYYPLEAIASHDNATFDYADLKGKPTFINFYFTSCPPCIEEIPALNTLRDEYKDKVNFIAITFDDRHKVRRYSKRFNFDYDQVVNARDLTSGLGVQGFPLNLLLSKNEVQTHVYPMLHDIESVKQDIEALLDN